MLFAPRRRIRSDIDLGPMVDVIFQLLIFFVLTSVAASSAIPLTLPRASTAVPAEAQALEVVVDEFGRCFFEGSAMAPHELLAQLSSRLHASPEISLTVRAHKHARHEAVVGVLDAAREAGLKTLRIACDRVSGQPK